MTLDPSSLLRQIVAYVGVGLVAAVGHYSVLVALVELLRQDAVLASLAGFLVGGVISYVLNRRYTFISDRSHEAAVPRFVLVTGIGFALTWLLMTALTALGSLHYLVAQVITTVAVLGWNFTANRLWTFRPATPALPPAPQPERAVTLVRASAHPASSPADP